VAQEKVCEESRRPFTWYYDDSKQIYVRKDRHGNKDAWLSGSELPDPTGIFEMRTRLIAEEKLPKDSRVHADPVTCQLWEHWQALQL